MNNSSELFEPIAITGIGCRFGTAATLDDFWRLLCKGESTIGEVPNDRWNAEKFYNADPEALGKIVNKRGSFVEHIDQFDWRTFRIPPREAKYMDPQQRLLLEVAWEAIEDAGLPLSEIAGTRTGVFIGIMWNDYLRMQTKDVSRLNGYSSTGNAFAFAPNKISYFFDLKGPSLTIDTACASSITSVHYACQSIRTGESELALAGGVNLMLVPDSTIMLSKSGVLSAAGQCRALDAEADGFVRGEGAGLLVLKPLSKVKKSERIYALIRGSAVNHNGRNEWIMASSAQGQRSAILEACNRAQIKAEDLDYVELHGTGLLKGDALEANTVGSVVGQNRTNSKVCKIGSIKPNIGHTDAAAGVASIIKVAMALHHNVIPPTINYKTANPDISLEKLGLSVQAELGKFPEKSEPILAGVTAVSMSGVNAHIILQEAAQWKADIKFRTPAVESRKRILALSAATREALTDLVQKYTLFLSNAIKEKQDILENLCFTASVKRSHFKKRLAVVGDTIEEMRDKLELYLKDEIREGVFEGQDEKNIDEMLEKIRNNGQLVSVVSELLKENAQGKTIVVPSEMLGKEKTDLHEAICFLYVNGFDIDWKVIPSDNAHTISIPGYPWQRERLWIEQDETQVLNDVKERKQEDGKREQQHDDLLIKLIKESPNRRKNIIVDFLRKQISETLGLNEHTDIGKNARLFELGIDSIGAVELVNKIRAALNFELVNTLIFDYPTLEGLASFLSDNVVSEDESKEETGSEEKDGIHDDEKILERLDAISEEEAEALLINKLSNI